MSTNMGNLEKLGILVIVILVVVVGVVAITPKSTVDERLYPDGQKPADVAKEPETLETAPPGVPGSAPGADPLAVAPGKTDPWPSSDPLPAPGAQTPPKTAVDGKAIVPAGEPAPSFRMAKIQKGDTFSTIARRELGSAVRFKEIQDANPGLLSTKLVAGKEIKIPVAAPTTPPAPGGNAMSGTAMGPSPGPVAPVPAPMPVSDGREYVVKSGDTLSSIASHELGSTRKWPEIATANEDVLHGSTALKVGMKLRIPASGGAHGGESTAVASHDPVAPAPMTSTEHEYVVKAGDSLWGIAKNEMGSEKCLSQLKDANADVLKGSDALKVGMKLKIPAKK